MEEEKRVDESWKNKVEQEKEATPKQTKDEGLSAKSSKNADTAGQKKEPQMPDASFNVFATSLGMQALMFLGEIENPMTNKKETDILQAKYLIDTLGMLEEKTKGNLEQEEKQVMTQLLYELRLKFVEKSK